MTCKTCKKKYYIIRFGAISRRAILIFSSAFDYSWFKYNSVPHAI